MAKAELNMLLDGLINLIGNGVTELRKELILENIRDVKEMVSFDPVLLQKLSIIYSMLDENNRALEILKEAENNFPDNPNIPANIGIIYSKIKEFEKSETYFRKSLQISPENSETYYNLGVMFQEQNMHGKAVEAFTNAVNYNPKHYNALFNRGLSYLMLGNYEAGWEDYEYGFYTGARVKREIPGSRWSGEELLGKTIYIYSNQGYGDAIQFARFIPLLSNCKKIYFEVQKELLGLFEGKFDNVELIEQNPDLSISVKADYYLPLLSLPYELKISKENIPHPLDLSSYLNRNSNEKKKIGIVWRGNRNHKNDRKRSMKLEEFIPLLELTNFEFYNLQIDVDETEKRILSDYNIIDITAGLNDFKRTAEVVGEMDMIITVDTAMVHLACSIGIKTLLLLDYNSEWRWGITGDETVWYPSVKIYRQDERRDWKFVIESVIKDIK